MRINNKDPWEWAESELQSLIDNEIPEALTLEYKGSGSLDKTDEKKRDISKDISAMANSNGGVLIYGIRTYGEGGKKQVPQGFDGGVDPSQTSIEWLEQVSDSNIQPRIDGLRFHSIKSGGESAGKVAYVVCIPKSTCAHQAADKRYYGRIERTIVPLEDYQIRDINNRSKHPILTPYFTLKTVQKRNKEVAYNFEIYLENTGAVRARDWALEVVIPSGVKNIRAVIQEVTVTRVGVAKLQIRIDRWSGQQVIFPQDKQQVYVGHSVTISDHDFNFLAEKGILSWRVFADDAPLRSDETKFLSIDLDGEKIAERI